MGTKFMKEQNQKLAQSVKNVAKKTREMEKQQINSNSCTHLV